MRQEVVAQRHGLRLLEMRVGGDHPLPRRLRLVDQRCGKPPQTADPLVRRPPQVQAQVERHLVVAGAPGVQLARHLAHQLAQPTLDGTVHVLVALGELELAAAGLVADLLQGSHQLGGLFFAQEPHRPEHLDVGQGTGHVVAQKASIGRRHRETPHRLVWRPAESPTPQGHSPSPNRFSA